MTNITMLEEDKAALFDLVYDSMETRGWVCTWDSIAAAHAGRPDGRLVTMGNQHLFRQFRNYVSAEPQALIDEATNAAVAKIGD